MTASGLLMLGGGGHAGVIVRTLEAALSAGTAGAFAGPGGISSILLVGATEEFAAELKQVLKRHLTAGCTLALTDDASALAAVTAPSAAMALRWHMLNGIGRPMNRDVLAKLPERLPSASERVVLHYERAAAQALAMPPVIHPSAITLDRFIPAGDRLAAEAGPGSIAPGVQLHAMAILGARSRAGRHAVVNTRASVDHDCDLGDFAFVGPGAVLCGGVKLGRGAFVGAGSTLLPGTEIGEGAVVPGGTTISGSVPAFTVAVDRDQRRRQSGRSL